MIDESQKPVTDGYREGWERVFGKKEPECPRCEIERAPEQPPPEQILVEHTCGKS